MLVILRFSIYFFQHYPSDFSTAVMENPLWKTKIHCGKCIPELENNIPEFSSLFSATSGGKQCGKQWNVVFQLWNAWNASPVSLAGDFHARVSVPIPPS